MSSRIRFPFIPEVLTPIFMSDVNHAWTKVWREIEGMGFACRRLATCQVYLELFDSAYGYQWYGDRSDGRVCGDIVLPRISLSHWKAYFSGITSTSLVDVLRHEYGHAFADVNRRRVESKRFEKTFGSPHDIEHGEDYEHDPECHVTPYAATSTGEDFAEVFWLHLKHKGKLPRHLDTAPIRRKWKFVEELRKG